jgi:DNA-binding NarL/FixJ family response regulator
VKVLIADDQAVVRLGFTAMLAAQPDLEVVGSAADGRAAVELARLTRPDVVLMDIRMPVLGGIDATRELQSLDPAPKVIVLTTFDIDDYVYDALRAGASGFLLKDATPAQILDAIYVVAAGDALLAPVVTRRLISEFAAMPRLVPPAQLSELTGREREVFVLVARGLANAEIAITLHLAEQTVKSHVSAVLSKLGLRDRVQAVVLAYESGIVIPGTVAERSRRGSANRIPAADADGRRCS